MGAKQSICGLTFGVGMPKICVPLMGKTVQEIREAAKLLDGVDAELVEWRADHFLAGADPKAVLDVLAWLRPLLLPKRLLFTFRTAAEGGELAIEGENYESLLCAVASSKQVDLIDVEGFAKGVRVKELCRRLRELGVFVIVSNHNFQHTAPQPELVHILCALEALDGDFVKLAVMPQNASDVEALLAATREYTNRPQAKLAITMSMGALGVRSRVEGERTGSVLTFGAVGKVSAPGQLEVSELRRQLKALHDGMVQEA